MIEMKPQSRTLPDLKTILLGEIQEYTSGKPYLLEMIQTCAILRWFDDEVVAVLLPSERAAEAPDLVEQIRGLSFCDEHRFRGLTLNPLLRDALLSQEALRSRAPALHRGAASAFQQLLQKQDLRPEDWLVDPAYQPSPQDLAGRSKEQIDQVALDWKLLAAEWLYHLAWVDPDEAWRQMMLIFAQTYALIVDGRVEVAFSFDLLNRIGFDQVEWPKESPYPGRVKELQRRIQALLAFRDKDVLDYIEELAATPGLTEKQVASLYQWIGSTCFRDAEWHGRARQRLEAAHQKDPTDWLILTELSACYSNMGILWGRMDLARQYAEEAVRLWPDHPEGYLELGYCCRLLSDWDAAIEYYRQARRHSPQSIDAVLGLSEVYTARHRAAPEGSPDAEDDLKMALNWIDTAKSMSMGMGYTALIRRGNAYQAYLEYDKAQQEFTKASQEEPERAEAYLSLGKLAVELGQHRQAEAYFQESSEKGAAAEAALLASQMVGQQNKIERAISACRVGLEQAKGSLSLYRQLHNLYSAQARWEEMEQVWEAWLAQDPGSEYMALCLKGDAYQAQAWKQRSANEKGQYSLKATGCYQQALRNDACPAWAHEGLGELALLYQDPAALNEQRQAVETCASWALYDVLVLWGGACLKNQQYAQAQALLEEALRLSPQRPEARQGLVDLYEATEDEERLLQTWAELETLDPTLSRTARLRTGDYYQGLLDYERARQQYELAACLPNPAEAKLRLAKLSKDQSNWHTAQENYRWVQENAPIFGALTQAEISEIFLKNQSYAEAESAARRAIASDPENIAGYIALASLGIQQENRNLLHEARGRFKTASRESSAELELAIADRYRAKAETILKEGNKVKDGWSAHRCLRKARQAYLQAIEENQRRGQDYPEAELGLALMLVSTRHYKLAEKKFQNALELFDPQQDFDAYLKLGEAFEKAGNLKQAEQNYRRAIAISGIHPFGHLFLASVLRKQGRPDEATREYLQAKETGKVNCLLLGRYYESQDRLEDALACYQMGKDNSLPEDQPDVYLAAATVQIHAGHVVEAEADLKHSLQLAPTLEGYQALLALLVDQQRFSDAEAVLEPAVEQADLAYDVLVFYGQTLVTFLKTRAVNHLPVDQPQSTFLADRAAEVFRRARDMDPTQEGAYQALGLLLEERQFYDQAFQLYVEMSAQAGLAYQAHIATGRLHEEREKLAEAEQAYQQATFLEPKKTDGYWYLAELHKNQGKTADAIELYQKVIELAADPNLLSFACTYLGELYAQTGQFEQAVAAFQQALEQHPANDEASYQLGLLYEQNADREKANGKLTEAKEDYEKAARMYTRSVDINPKYGEAYIGLGRVYGELCLPKKVVELARRLGKLSLEKGEQYGAGLVIAVMHAESGQKLKARVAYRQLIRMDPGKVEAYEYLASLLEESQKPNLALAVYTSMTKQPELCGRAYLLRGDLLARQAGRLEQAMDNYRQAIIASPDEPDPYVKLAAILMRQVRQAELQELLQQVAARQRPYLSARVNCSLGDVFQQQEKYAEAEQAFREAADQVPADPEAYLKLAELYDKRERFSDEAEMLRRLLHVSTDERLAEQTYIRLCILLLDNLKRTQEALEILQAAVHRLPNNEVLYYHLGRAHQELEQWAKARNAYLKASEIAPKYGAAYVGLAQVYRQLKDINGIHRIARKLERMKLGPEEEYDAYLLIARVYWEGNFPEWAIETLKKAAALNPERDKAYNHLGYIYEMGGQRLNAVTMYEKALQAKPAPDQETEAGIHLALGRCYLLEAQAASGIDSAQQDDQSKAEAELLRAIELGPGQGQAYFSLGMLYEDQDRWEEALKVYQQEAERIPELRGSAYLRIAAIQRRLGRADEQRSNCQAALDLAVDEKSTNYSTFLRRKGLAHLMLDEYQEADKALRQVLEKDCEDFGAHFYEALSLLGLDRRSEASLALRAGIRYARQPGDYRYVLEEANALIQRKPGLAGLPVMIEELEQARERTLNR